MILNQHGEPVRHAVVAQPSHVVYPITYILNLHTSSAACHHISLSVAAADTTFFNSFPFCPRLADFSRHKRLAMHIVSSLVYGDLVNFLSAVHAYIQVYAASTCFEVSQGISLIPSLPTIFTVIPLKSIGRRRCNSSVHIRKISRPFSSLIEGWWCLSRIERQ